MDIIDKLARDRPKFHLSGTTAWDASVDTLRAIKGMVHDGNRTLETGCGASTVIFVAQGANHTTISTEAEEHNLVRNYLKAIDVDASRLESIIGESQSVLPTLRPERILDVAFIDGGHAFPYPVIDWYYSTGLLKVGGKLILDDIPIPAIACVFRFMESDPSWRLDNIIDGRAAAFTLVDVPSYGDHRLQAFNSHLDYGFAPLPQRARLILSSEIARIRRQIGLRYPSLKQAYRRYTRA